MQHSSKGDERREFQRLHLETPIAAVFGTTPVAINEIGILGARIHHSRPLDAERGDLRFFFGTDEIVMRCEVVRAAASHSGIRFLAALEDSGERLRSMLARLVEKALDEKAESSGTKLQVRRNVDGDKTVRGTDANFISFRLEDGSWKKRHVFLPEQPSVGFTVARGEDAEEMRRLCEVYEASDEEGRRLIRMFAELSVSSLLKIPPSS